MREEEDADNPSVGMYPVMPSLVGLQQMRNRHNLACLGRKLMKMSAFATGRELRKVAGDIVKVYDGFGEEVKSGFIELARCRFIEPSFNEMVLQNVPKYTCVTVKGHSKSFSGVKIKSYEIVDSGLDPYPHLLLAKSSDEIKTTKDIWRHLLLRMIFITQLRQSFTSLDEANKNATKRQNVLSKVVIPKTKNTTKYILLELEELAREELYRIKKIKQKKLEKQQKGKIKQVCPVCKDKMREQPTVNRCLWCGAWIGLGPPPSKHMYGDDPDRRHETLPTVCSIPRYKESCRVMPEYIEINNLCTSCMKNYTDLYCNKLLEIIANLQNKTVSKGHDPYVIFKKETDNKDGFDEDTKKLIKSGEAHDDSMSIFFENDLELGTFETDVKEVTKIIRKINVDGTIDEEKKVIRVERNTCTPFKDGQSKQWILFQSSILNFPYKSTLAGSNAAIKFDENQSLISIHEEFSDLLSNNIYSPSTSTQNEFSSDISEIRTLLIKENNTEADDCQTPYFTYSLITVILDSIDDTDSFSIEQGKLNNFKEKDEISE